MLTLVARTPALIKSDVCPETLLFDVQRISKLQHNFQRIVIASTMMVTTFHAVGAQKLIAADREVADVADGLADGLG